MVSKEHLEGLRWTRLEEKLFESKFHGVYRWFKEKDFDKFSFIC